MLEKRNYSIKERLYALFWIWLMNVDPAYFYYMGEKTKKGKPTALARKLVKTYFGFIEVVKNGRLS